MSASSTSDFAQIQIDTITIGDRSREVDMVWVNALAAMFKTGEMLNPVTIWRDAEDRIQLIAGAHRIAAQKLNGETHIAAKWSQATSMAEAKILEITENIGRRELNALDRAQHLSDLKDAHEELYPEARRGGDKQTAGAREKLNEIISFSSDAAETLGISERSIQMAVAMWAGLTDATKVTASGTWLADHQAGLMQLAKQTPTVQAKALALIFPPNGGQPKAANVPDALYILENGRVLSSVEKRFSGLNRTFGALADEELDAVLTVHEERIMAWVKRRLDGERS
jgi:ParB family chromosome partitioning protein